MAREPGSNDVRFPLRRQAEPESAPAPTPAPRPAPEAKPARDVRSWLPGRTAAPSPLELTGGLPPPERVAPVPEWRRAAPPPPPAPTPPPPPTADAAPAGYTSNLPVLVRRNPWKWVTRGIALCILLFVLAVAWLAVTAPLSKSLQPPAPPSITLLSAEGTPIARRGAVIGEPIDAAKLPAHVRDAFVAIEDRRFYGHWGVDPRGILRAFVHNVTSSGGSQGGSTITQQLAKNAFLTQERTATRKFQEVLIAFWLEAWLSKQEILSRYLSNVYFGDNVYGLRAASRHYFSAEPEDLNASQATLLAGLVQAPSRLAPTGNLKGARDRQKLVIGSMLDAGLITKAEAAAIRPAVLRVSRSKELPNGTYFADWVLPQARDRAGGVATEQTVKTTLEMPIQQAAERVVKSAGLRGLQVAMVAMRPDGRVVAMVGGRSYGQSPFNRATQARRQPGSTFKLFVYLAALRSGMTPDTMVDDSPVTIGEWSPTNSDGRYAGRITLRQAFAKSSNVVSARLTAKIGVGNVIRAARDLGISTPISNEASIALGTSTVSLLELTSAYAAIANGSYPVRPVGLSDDESADDWLAKRLGAATRFRGDEIDDLRSMLESVVAAGTGRSAALSIPAYGKTGTTQDNRDALFVGYAGGLVAGVWIGNDDNSPSPGLAGGGLPARIWRDFMTRALDLRAPPPPEPVEEVENAIDEGVTLDDVLNGLDGIMRGGPIETEIDPGDPRDPDGGYGSDRDPRDERRRGEDRDRRRDGGFE
ncbi:transglycosylase domain-containing protein [Sphingomonas hengshuiensis]|uniref:transglycosylase domain-containing protein n=1 Tax=Sphingomonas hengshuiensis TaxID=1609977 RepID=UPI000980AB8D|nr:PBP1A family penicillin-binding protein [Sphingomonas hengshuiensis]